MNICHRAIDIHNPKGNAKNSGFCPRSEPVDRWLEQVYVPTGSNPDLAGLYSWWSNRGRAREKDLAGGLTTCSPIHLGRSCDRGLDREACWAA